MKNGFCFTTLTESIVSHLHGEHVLEPWDLAQDGIDLAPSTPSMHEEVVEEGGEEHRPANIGVVLAI
jgi:hypothetical protein